LRYTLFPAVRPISVVHAGTTHTGRTTPAVSNETTVIVNVAVIANSRPCRGDGRRPAGFGAWLVA
jgi:hypothetical protein